MFIDGEKKRVTMKDMPNKLPRLDHLLKFNDALINYDKNKISIYLHTIDANFYLNNQIFRFFAVST